MRSARPIASKTSDATLIYVAFVLHFVYNVRYDDDAGLGLTFLHYNVWKIMAQVIQLGGSRGMVHKMPTQVCCHTHGKLVGKEQTNRCISMKGMVA